MDEATEAIESKVVHEGKAKITFTNPNEVFYNPVQVFNRDLSVACIQVYTEELFPLTIKFKKKIKQKNAVEEEDISVDQSSANDQTNTGTVVIYHMWFFNTGLYSIDYTNLQIVARLGGWILCKLIGRYWSRIQCMLPCLDL